MENYKETINETLVQIRNLDRKKEYLEFEIKEKREKIFQLLKQENLKQFKTGVATVAYTKRQTLNKYDEKDVLEQLRAKPENERFYDTVPEHVELNKTFTDSIKNGTLKVDGVECTTKELPMIRFNLTK